MTPDRRPADQPNPQRDTTWTRADQDRADAIRTQVERGR